MNILTCTDKNFVIPTGVMLYSVCKHNPCDNLNLYVIVDKTVTMKQKKQMEKQVKIFKYANIHFIRIDVSNIEKYLVVKTACFPISIYYRLLLTDLLPQTIDKILYLDADIIVRHNLSDLWETDISNNAIGAVVNQSNGKNSWERLNYPKEKAYFNSGVLLINIHYWREHLVTSSLIDYIKNNPDKLVYPDQDALNYVLQDKKLLLPERYNVQEAFYRLNREIVPNENSEEIEKALENPYILHFTYHKPWFIECEHPLRHVYFDYKKETIWKHNMYMEFKHLFRFKYVKDLYRNTNYNIKYKTITLSN